MKPRTLTGVFVLVSVLAFSGAWAQSKSTRKTDDQIRQEMIAASIAAYSGSCPCPYNTDRRGHRCGGRSAYSRPGGASPLCYAKDVTKKMVDDYRKRTGE